MTTLTNEELVQIIKEQLPRLLAEEPDLLVPLYRLFLESFTDWGEFGRLRQQLTEFQSETQKNFEIVHQRFGQIDRQFEQIDQRFEQVDQRFEQVDQRLDGIDQRFDRLEARLEQGFKEMTRQIDRLGQRWGIRNEALFRTTMADLLEESFGVKVQRRIIEGEEFDVVISNGDHILVEIAASAKRNIRERLERKRQLYIQETGIIPTRFLYVIASINSRQAEALRQAGFDVIEPEEDEGEEGSAEVLPAL